MRKFIAACFTIFFVASAAATTIESEEVRIDLATSEVEVELQVGELTSERLSYLTNYPVRDVEAEVNGTSIPCDVTPLQVGSEIQCDPQRRANFTVDLEFQASELLSTRQRTTIFRYSQNFYRPTEEYRLRVVLPKGAGLLEDRNVSSPVISPPGAETGSNGRRIFVEWEKQPELGETLNFQVLYQDYSSSISPAQIAAMAVLAALLALAAYYGYRRLQMEDIENVYDELDRDEKQVLDLLRENEGSMLQKDVVASMDYSKAKISGIVSGLVEKEVVKKEKEGRSNRLSISRNYRA
ncbi:MAG: helix-turn-helix transcriptional regulator [Candidatus Nanohaloarchaea archaeon]